MAAAAAAVAVVVEIYLFINKPLCDVLTMIVVE